MEMERKSFFTYYKTILQKVSFDPELLNKEYRKALQSIHPSDHDKLENWMRENGLKQRLYVRRELNKTA